MADRTSPPFGVRGSGREPRREPRRCAHARPPARRTKRSMGLLFSPPSLSARANTQRERGRMIADTLLARALCGWMRSDFPPLREGNGMFVVRYCTHNICSDRGVRAVRFFARASRNDTRDTKSPTPSPPRGASVAMLARGQGGDFRRRDSGPPVLKKRSNIETVTLSGLASPTADHSSAFPFFVRSKYCRTAEYELYLFFSPMQTMTFFYSRFFSAWSAL